MLHLLYKSFPFDNFTGSLGKEKQNKKGVVSPLNCVSQDVSTRGPGHGRWNNLELASKGESKPHNHDRVPVVPRATWEQRQGHSPGGWKGEAAQVQLVCMSCPAFLPQDSCADKKRSPSESHDAILWFLSVSACLTPLKLWHSFFVLYGRPHVPRCPAQGLSPGNCVGTGIPLPASRMHTGNGSQSDPHPRQLVPVQTCGLGPQHLALQPRL